MISRIIKVEVGVISQSRGLRLIKPNLIIVLLKWKLCYRFFTDGKQHKSRELDMITLRNHAPRSYMI